MKELFEPRHISTKQATVTLSTGEKWEHRKSTIAHQIMVVVDEYFPRYILSLRQLYYQLVVKEFIRNDEVAYKMVSKILADLMYSGMVDWDAIEDRGRKPNMPYYENSPGEALSSWADFYKINRQLNQPNYVEVWSEKDALSSLLGGVCTTYGIPLVVNKGYGSNTALHKAYLRIGQHIRMGRTVTLLYLGDFDPSGLDMIRDIYERVRFFLLHGKHAVMHAKWFEKSPDCFRVVPIGLTLAQIRQYKPLPNPVKITDKRAKKFIALYGPTSYEVDALEPSVLLELVKSKILENIDVAAYDERMKIEGEQREQMHKVADDFEAQYGEDADYADDDNFDDDEN